MIEREISEFSRFISTKTPIFTITGPRHSGKTTLVRHLFSNKPYANLERPDTRQFALEDPVAFLRQFPDGAILDEIQRAPELTSYLQAIVDEKQENGLFILTGSRQFEVIDTINQSLAGRTSLIKLLPFSLSEIEFWKPNSLDKILSQGLYPRIWDQEIPAAQALGDYFETYVERDIRQISNIKNLSLFQKFVRLCASRVGQLLNLQNLANDTGISHTTAREWISLLEASYIVFLLEPYHKNIRKRLVKSRKIYFYDCGLAAWLCGIENEGHLRNHPLRGHFFENLMVIEALKFRYNHGLRNNLSFYRDSSGNEVDLLYQIADKFLPIEIKSGETIASDYFKGFNNFKKIEKDLPYGSMLIYGGNTRQERTETSVVPYFKFGEILKDKTSS